MADPNFLQRYAPAREMVGREPGGVPLSQFKGRVYEPWQIEVLRELRDLPWRAHEEGPGVLYDGPGAYEETTPWHRNWLYQFQDGMKRGRRRG